MTKTQFRPFTPAMEMRWAHALVWAMFAIMVLISGVFLFSSEPVEGELESFAVDGGWWIVPALFMISIVILAPLARLTNKVNANLEMAHLERIGTHLRNWENRGIMIMGAGLFVMIFPGLLFSGFVSRTLLWKIVLLVGIILALVGWIISRQQKELFVEVDTSEILLKHRSYLNLLASYERHDASEVTMIVKPVGSHLPGAGESTGGDREYEVHLRTPDGLTFQPMRGTVVGKKGWKDLKKAFARRGIKDVQWQYDRELEGDLEAE